MSITYGQLFGQIQEHFLQTNDSGVTWVGVSQTEVLSAFNSTLSKINNQISILRGSNSDASSTAAIRTLNANTQNLTRILWLESGVYYPLVRTDYTQLDYGRPGWQALTGTPDSYIEHVYDNSVKIQLVPAPASAGVLVSYYTQLPLLSAISLGTAVGSDMPDAVAPYIKWGAVAELLGREGPLNEPARAAYAEERFQEGLQLIKLMLGGSNA
jgi:hypothetical protein